MCWSTHNSAIIVLQGFCWFICIVWWSWAEKRCHSEISHTKTVWTEPGMVFFAKVTWDTLDFSETIVVYNITVDAVNLNEYMKLYGFQMSRSFIDLGPNHDTCDQTQYRRDLPTLGFQVRVPPDRPKLPIYMNSDFSLLPKAKTCFLITADACFI